MDEELIERENGTSVIVPPSQANEELLAGRFRRWLQEVMTRIRSIGGNLILQLMGKNNETSLIVANQRNDTVFRVRDDGSLEAMDVQVFIEPWINGRLINSWQNYNVNLYSKAGFYKQPLGQVMLRGMIKNGSAGADIYTLPLSHTNDFKLNVYPTINSGGMGRVNVINPDAGPGAVRHISGSNAWASLDGIEYPATSLDWSSMTLINGWTNSGGDHNTAGYYRDKLGMVWLKGVMNQGTADNFAQPPTGILPPYTEVFPVITGNGAGRAFIRSISDTNGIFAVNGDPGFAWASIDNVRYHTRDDIWIAPRLINGWTNHGGSLAPAGYWRDPFGVVRLRGAVAPGSGTIFTLPVGYRPEKEVWFPAAADGQGVLRAVYVTTGGDVRVDQNPPFWVSLSGVAFKTA